MKTIISLFISVFIVNFIVVISLLTAAKISWGLAVTISVILGLLTVFFSIYYRKWSLSWAALIAVVASLLCGMYISDYADLQGRNIIRDISIEEAIKYPEAAGYTFTDGFVNSDLRATYQKTRSSTSGPGTITYYYAAPVVNKNWDPSKAITVFAVREITADTKNWASSFRAGIRAPASSYDDLKSAVNKCIKVHNLKHIKNPIMIRWVKSPEKVIEKYKEDMLDTLIIWNMVLLLGLLIFRIIYYLKRRKKTSGEPEKISNN